MLVLLSFRRNVDTRAQLDSWLRRHGAVLRLAAWILLSMIVFGALLLFALRGVSTYEDYRYEAAVPILALQVVVSALAGKLLQRMLEGRTQATLARLDRWMFAFIWLLTAIYWAERPQRTAT
jgi:hypothetical protein